MTRHHAELLGVSLALSICLCLSPRAEAEEAWGPPPPTAPPSEADQAAPAEPVAPIEPDVVAPAEPVAPIEPSVPVETGPVAETEAAAEAEGAAEAERSSEAAEAEGPARQLLERLGIRVRGYSRLPLNLHVRRREGTGSGSEGDADEGGGESYTEVRSPLLRDNDYFASGFEYTRLAETDWTELFLAVGSEDLEVEVGFFASLMTDWAHYEPGTQFGLAQASVHWQNIAGVPLSLKAGVFWERLGYIQPYDTYLFGRTHWMGLRLGWDFSNGGEIRLGFGANKEWYERNVGLTPLVYAYGGTPLVSIAGRPFLSFNGYLLYSFMNDIPPHQADNWQRAHLGIMGLDFELDFAFEGFEGPLYLGIAGYFAEHSVFMAGVTEMLHSWSGRGLTENYFGLQSQDGTGSIFAAALDWPMRIMDRFGLRLFGLLAHVWSEQRAGDPLENRDGQWKLKWGLEPSYQIRDWLRISMAYHRVIPVVSQDLCTDCEDYDASYDESGGLPSLSFRALAPELAFMPSESIRIRLQYIHYFYGDDVELRPGQALLVERPDEDVFRIAAEAVW